MQLSLGFQSGEVNLRTELTQDVIPLPLVLILPPPPQPSHSSLLIPEASSAYTYKELELYSPNECSFSCASIFWKLGLL